MLEEFSYDYIEQALKSKFTVMERKELFEFFSQTSFNPLTTKEIKFPQRLEIDAGQFVTVALTTLLTAIGAMALNEKWRNMAS